MSRPGEFFSISDRINFNDSATKAPLIRDEIREQTRASRKKTHHLLREAGGVEVESPSSSSSEEPDYAAHAMDAWRESKQTKNPSRTAPGSTEEQ